MVETEKPKVIDPTQIEMSKSSFAQKKLLLLINLAGDHNHYQLGDQEEGLRSKRKQM
jgi:hypothetical protein